MYDIIIKNGVVVDGTGKTRYKADIAVKSGKIAAIGQLGEIEARKVLDARGRHVTPGFIDPHSHSDMSLLVWPKNEAYTLQGVTTQICGNCGLAAAPIGDETWEFWCWEYKCMNKVHKSLFEPYVFQTPKEKMVTALKEDYGLEVSWKTLGEFMELAEGKGFSCNYYPLSGHNHIRNAVMGDAKRHASDRELEQMIAVLRGELEAGSQGFSTGLDYEPGRNANMAEIEALVRVAGEYGGVYNTHVRGFDPKKPKGTNRVYGIREATRICRNTGVKTNIAHMSPLFDYEPVQSSEADHALAKASVWELERGWREEGLPMMYDVIANTSMGGSTLAHLAAMVRPWILMSGSVEAFLRRSEYKDFVDMMKEQVAAGKGGMLSRDTSRAARMIKVAGCSEPKFAYRTLQQIMEDQCLDSSVDAILAVLRSDPYAGMTFEMGGSEETIKILLGSEIAMPCSDGFAFDLDTQMDMPRPLNRPPHPNNFCYAVRYLLNYGGPRLEDKIRQMTGVPAAWFNILDRGTLEVGKWADIVILDLENLRTNEDPVNPGKAPDGINYVLINGTIAADHKKHTGALAGKVLRRA